MTYNDQNILGGVIVLTLDEKDMAENLVNDVTFNDSRGGSTVTSMVQETDHK